MAIKTDFSNFIYNAPPTLARFHQSDARVRIVRGPVGSGKTTSMIMELLRRAAEQSPGSDGIRRTRAIITRNTLQQLKSTCLVSIQQLLRPISSWKVSDSTLTIKVNDIESEWFFLPLDTEENVQRLLSLEATFAWGSEIREMNPELIRAVLSRCGRYPSKAIGGPTWYGFIGESNSFTTDSPWYDLLEHERPKNWDYFVQPGAMEPDAENRENLVPNYYEDLMESNTDAWVNQYIHNEYGPSLSGQAVFHNTFIPEFHVHKKQLEPVPGYPICIGMDMARCPAAILTQIDNAGTMRVMHEIVKEGVGVEKFVTEYLVPVLASTRFAGHPVYIVGDPSAIRKSEIGEESTFDMLKRLGFQALPAQTNLIEPRLRAVDKWLLQQRQGKAAMLFDAKNCQKLILAMQDKYRYKIHKNGGMEEKPEKIRPWADLADALQYACLGSSKRLRGRIMRPRKPEVTRPAFTAAAWT